jgi:hypothetical protein
VSRLGLCGLEVGNEGFDALSFDWDVNEPGVLVRCAGANGDMCGVAYFSVGQRRKNMCWSVER